MKYVALQCLEERSAAAKTLGVSITKAGLADVENCRLVLLRSLLFCSALSLSSGNPPSGVCVCVCICVIVSLIRLADDIMLQKKSSEDLIQRKRRFFIFF